ncbi:MAG: LppX_LprAFG lipoprotein [Anaerolinea sp.]|nr:LppX_LprAFG lipoprotein [Anaerolinea sp.]
MIRTRSSILSAALAALFVTVTLSSCTGSSSATPTPTPDPIALVRAAAEAIRSARTFRMIVDQTGPDYAIETDFGSVNFRRADAYYVAPDTMQADISVTALGGLRIDVQVFARAADQWFRSRVWTAGNWIYATFAPGFNPATLIAEETGFNAALSAVIDLVYAGEVTLEDGQRAWRISGRADATGVNALLIGLIEMSGEVAVDVFINADTGFPARFVLTETLPESEPRIWTMDILGIDQDVSLDLPPEPTAEVTAPVDNQPFIGTPGS